MPQFTGRAEIRVGGVLYPTAEGAAINNPMAMSRQPVVGVRNYGYTEKVETPDITAKFKMNADISLDDLWAVKDQTVTFECDDGSVYVLGGATMGEISNLTAGDQAELAIKIIGTSCDKQ